MIRTLEVIPNSQNRGRGDRIKPEIIVRHVLSTEDPQVILTKGRQATCLHCIFSRHYRPAGPCGGLTIASAIRRDDGYIDVKVTAGEGYVKDAKFAKWAQVIGKNGRKLCATPKVIDV